MSSKRTTFFGGNYGCKMEQHCGQHGCADCHGGSWVRRVVGDWLQLAGGVNGDVLPVVECRQRLKHERPRLP